LQALETELINLKEQNSKAILCKDDMLKEVIK
jgi:hypothetical protein